MGRVYKNFLHAVRLALSDDPENHKLGCILLMGYIFANRNNPQLDEKILELYELVCRKL